MTNVLVVDDSSVMRTIVETALTDAGHEVDTAVDGREAVEAVRRHRPDIVTMDVVMPELDGIEAVERIMAEHPTPIVMLSAYTTEGAEATLDALERGAVDYIPKPTLEDDGARNVAHLAEDVVEIVGELASANVSALAPARTAAAASATRREGTERTAAAGSAATPSDAAGGRAAGTTAVHSTTEPTARTAPTEPTTATPPSEPIAPTEPTAVPRPAERTADRVDVPETVGSPTIVLGASTGGPKIVERLLRRLPTDLEAKLLVVQHMPAAFTDRFAERLDLVSDYDVREARDGDRLAAGEALVAPGGSHLEVASNAGGRIRVELGDGERIHGVRPAIDVTMRTAAERVTGPLCGIVLTGMGADGAAGIEAIHDAGGRTIAQDEATSPVFGIPRQAIETGCVDAVVPAGAIVEEIVETFSTEGGR